MRLLIHSMLRAAVGLCMLLSLAGGLPAGLLLSGAQAQATTGTEDWRPSEDDQWLFDLRTERFRIGDGVRGYANGSDVCIDLGDMVRALNLPIRIDRQLGRASGWAFDEHRTILIDREAGEVRIGSSVQRLNPRDIVDTPVGWCVRPDRLAHWLGLTLTPDLNNSILRLTADQPLPFELAAERRARAASIRPATTFDLSALPRAERPYAVWQTPSVDVVATAQVRHDAPSQRTESQLRYELFASGEALGASFDARVASDNRGVPQSLRLTAYRADPNGQLLGPLHATQVAAGDVTGLMTPIGLDSAVGRGFIITNHPLDRPEAFDRRTFRGDLPAGWEAELYRNGELLGFASPDASGRYEFVDVRLLYGMNRFEIVLYGPQGQVRRDVQSVPVGIDSIPPRENHYWVGVFEEGRDLIALNSLPVDPLRVGWRGVAAIERGLDTRTGIGLFATTRVYAQRRYSSIEAALRRSIGTSISELSASVGAGGTYAARLVWAGPLGRGGFQLESMRLGGGYITDRLPVGVTESHSVSINNLLTLGGTALPFQLDARYRRHVDGSRRVEANARISASFRNISVTSRLLWQRSIGQAAGDVDDDVTAALLASVRLGRVRLRGEARVAVAGNARSAIAMVADWRQSDRADWRAELGYDPHEQRGRTALGYTRRFDRFALTGTAEAATDGSVGAAVTLSFGFGPDPRGGVRFSRERLATQGQAMAEVFRDSNGDGMRQDDEELVEGVVLTAGNATADEPTDASGRALIDALVPHRAVLIGIDESSLDDPLLRPALAGMVITPRPGVVTTVRLPLVPAGEVEGMLISPSGAGIEGVDLELVDGSGRIRSTVRSDFDGFFIFESVPYGTYQLRVGTLSAQVIGVSAMLRSITLDRAHPRIRVGDILLRAGETLADASPAVSDPGGGDAAAGARR